MHRTTIQAPPSVRHIFRWAWLVPLFVLPIHADVVVDTYQSGSNVVSSYSGTIDLTGLTPNGTDGITPAYIWGADATEVFGPTVGGEPVYLGIVGPTDFGDGAATEASSSTGDTFGYGGLAQDLLLPTGYVSGTFLSGTDTWDDTTLAGLGLTPGTYTYTWGTGADGSFTVDVGTASVPEPSTLGLISLVVLAMAFALLRYRLGRES
ncbi:MAG TPA: PEP-CTERM sorting domain-containing protein [Bryobacteraceae bacterium]